MPRAKPDRKPRADDETPLADRPVQRVISARGSTPPATTGQASVFAAARAAGPLQPNRRGQPKAANLPPLSESALSVHDSEPLPRARGRIPNTEFDAIFARLERDGMAIKGFPRAYGERLRTAVASYLRRHPEIAAASWLSVRTYDDTHVGVWRAPVSTRRRPGGA